MATEKTLPQFRKMASDQLKEREAELRTELFKLRTGGAGSGYGQQLRAAAQSFEQIW